MNTIITKKNNDLLNSFSEKFNLLDSIVSKILIFLDNNNDLTIDIYLKLSYPKNMNLQLKFHGIKEYSFYWNDNYIFYNIERFKFHKEKNLFYISLDPDGEDEVISSSDQDYILCETIEGLFSNDR